MCRAAAAARHRQVQRVPHPPQLERSLPRGRWLVVLVAHGDVLQILQTAFVDGMDPREHRALLDACHAEQVATSIAAPTMTSEDRIARAIAS